VTETSASTARQVAATSYASAVVIDLPFSRAVEAVRAALADQGFGVLTEIDVTATMKAKIDESVEDYVILGACNPTLAYAALEVDRAIGVMLPCNIVIRSTSAGTLVQTLDPHTMVALTGAVALGPIADEAADRLKAMLAALGTTRTPD